MSEAEGEQTADELLAGRETDRVPYQQRRDEHDLQRRKDEHVLRSKVARWAYRAVVAQIILADVVFIVYAWAGRGWDVPTPAITAWLSATVLQAVTVALVITRYLFPPDHD